MRLWLRRYQVSIKKRAMQTLKQKKMYEGQRDQMAAQGFNIDSTKFALDMVSDAFECFV